MLILLNVDFTELYSTLDILMTLEASKKNFEFIFLCLYLPYKMSIWANLEGK